MSIDNLKGVNFNVGQEMRAADLNDAQRFDLSRMMDQILEKLVPGPQIGDLEAGTHVLVPGEHGDDAPSNEFAFALHCGGAYPRKGTTNAKIQIAPGTLIQKIGARSGNEPTFLPYTFSGTEEVTIANGDATNPRVDLVQMKLEWETADLQARVFAQESVKASRDLGPLTANCETVIRARAGGFGGNAISIAFLNDGAGVGSFTQSGYALTFHYQSGVTTVANFETAVQAHALIEVQTSDGVGTLTHPGDTFSAVFLTGGSDQVLVSQNMNMKRRVKCTLSVLQGTPAASPVYPMPDSGYVVIAGVVVPATWTGVSAPIRFDSSATTSLVIHDQRMPLGNVRTYHVFPRDMIAENDGSHWSLDTKGRAMTAGAAASNELLAPLRSGSGGCMGGGKGRLIAIEVASKQALGPLLNTYLARLQITPPALHQIINLNVLAVSNLTDGANITQDRIAFEGAHDPAADGPTILPNAQGMGPPVWANGRRALDVADGTDQFMAWESLVFHHPSPSPTTTQPTIWRVTFFVAEGF